MGQFAVDQRVGETVEDYVRRRLREAARVHSALPGRPGPRSPGPPSWGRLIQPDWWQAYNREEARAVRLQPTADGIARADETLGWWQALAGDTLRRERLAVAMRAGGATWEAVAGALRCHRQTAERVERQGVALIVLRVFA